MKHFFCYSFNIIKVKKYELLRLSVLCLISSLVSLFLPLLSGSFLNNLIDQPQLITIMKFSLLFFFLNLLNMFLSFFIMKLNIHIQTDCSFRLNKRLLEKLQKVSILYIQNSDITYLNQRINNDSNAVVIFIISFVKDIIINMITMIISFAILLYIDPMIGCVFFVVFVFYMILYRYLKNKILDIRKIVIEKQSKYFSKLQEMLRYIKFIKVYSYNLFLLNSLSAKFKEMQEIIYKNQKYSYYLSASEQIILIATQIFLYIIGGSHIINGTLSIGMFTAMTSYFNHLVGSMKYFSSLYQQYLSTFVCYQRIQEIEKLDNDNIGKIKLKEINYIIIKDLSFSYQDRIVFSNLNVELHKSNIYLISGDNGKGKSTLINVLLGLYSTYRGNIYIDDVELKELDLYHFRQNFISFVDQRPILINNSVYENICLDKTIPVEEIQKYLIEFKLIDSNDQVSDFLNKNINEVNSNISGGECQKICLIREFIRNKPIMIFDEPTSNLDKESKYLFINKIQHLSKNHIIILVSHDLDILRTVDIKKIDL